MGKERMENGHGSCCVKSPLVMGSLVTQWSPLLLSSPVSQLCLVTQKSINKIKDALISYPLFSDSLVCELTCSPMKGARAPE